MTVYVHWTCAFGKSVAPSSSESETFKKMWMQLDHQQPFRTLDVSDDWLISLRDEEVALITELIRAGRPAGQTTRSWQSWRSSYWAQSRAWLAVSAGAGLVRITELAGWPVSCTASSSSRGRTSLATPRRSGWRWNASLSLRRSSSSHTG